MNEEAPLISCLCVTRHRVPLLQRAVACFLAQTHASRELVLLYESDDAATADYVRELRSPWVRAFEVPARPKLPLGSLRNLAVEAARGAYVTQWDDDDWHAPERLAAQLGALRDCGLPACALYRWTVYDEVTGRAYLSNGRAWEGSLLTRRNALPAYQALKRGEDTAGVEAMQAAGLLALLDRPDLYVYVYHGRNTWDRLHWKRRLLPWFEPLTADATQRVRALLALPSPRAPPAAQRGPG
jgi:glycosyltransferase involved in cell wall biosynthesis